MSLWLIVPIVYVIVVIGFLIAMYREAPKHGTRIGVLHYVVALVWPVWAIWYAYISISDAIRRRKLRRKK